MIIGSMALQYHDIEFRTPMDLDVFIRERDKAESLPHCDVQYVPDSVYNLLEGKDGHATPDAVYTIKLSHLPWDMHNVDGVHGMDGIWLKHYRDVQYLKRIGCKLLEPLYRALIEHWTQKNGDKPFLSLEQDKEAFFTDYVTYKYEHDYLHTLLSYPEEPIYLKCVRDGKEIDIDENKWYLLSFEDQVEFFRQEIGVIAVERWVVHKHIPLVTAWTLAVKKTITTLTKGYMSEFIVRNIEHFIKPNREQFKHIYTTLNLEESNMTKLTQAQVDQLKEDITAYIKPYRDNEAEWSDYEILLDDADFVDHAPFEFIEQEGGGEGGAEHCWSVFKFKDVFYKATFSYASYAGYDFYDDFYIVSPKEKTITVYE